MFYALQSKRCANFISIFQSGPAKLKWISKKLKNPFWKEILETIEPIQEAALFSYPEKILLASFWDNPLVKKNNRVITWRMFPEIAGAVTKLGDFFKPNSCDFLTLEEFNNKYTVDLSLEKFIDIRFTITRAFQFLGIKKDDIIEQCEPSQPLIVSIASMATKGCI